jgi:hypothetical protein
MDWQNLKPIKVLWRDHVSLDEWVNWDEAIEEKLHVILSRGYLIHENNHTIYVAGNVDPEGEKVSMVMIIDKANIIERVEE